MNNNTYTVTTERYEHRVIEEHNAGDYYGTDYIFDVGKVYYGDTLEVTELELAFQLRRSECSRSPRSLQ